MNATWIQIGASVVLPFLALLFGFLAGQRSRSITVATTVEKDWLNSVAEDLAEFTELQYDIVWKRWRLKLVELTDLELRSRPYENESFRYLQEALWKQTFRSDFLKTKLFLMLDDGDRLQAQLITAIEEYAGHADKQNQENESADKDSLFKIAAEVGDLLRVQKKSAFVAAGRRVLEEDDKRAPVERLGLGVAPLNMVEGRQVVEARRHARMLRPERPLPDGERAAIERLRLGVAPLDPVELRQVVQRLGHLGSLAARTL